jgi:4-hydroxythreonine-4-phosphate dehydrogenase
VSRPVLALTIGDPCGIGPEIALRLLVEGGLPAPVLLLGDARALARDARLVAGAPDVAREVPVVEDPRELAEGRAPFALLRASDLDGRLAMRTLPAVGTVDASAGRACHGWVLRACDLALAGRVDAVVTGPIHKQAWERAGVPEPGHTEALARRARVRRVLMLMVGGPLRVALATVHVALARVPLLLDEASLLGDLRLLDAELRSRYGLERPRVAVCGLNPHAGEGGRFGDEDVRTIAPAVEAARAEGLDVAGPLPADACIPLASKGRFDAVLAMYHDQGLVAVKTVAPRGAVNVTLGLPFVRTSVDHGTAFDRAGTGTATASSLRAAALHAVALSTRGSAAPT